MKRIRDITLGILIGSVFAVGAVEITAASNKAVIAEVLTRLHWAADPTFLGSHNEAAVDSLLVAYGSHAGLGRSATMKEFADHVWGDWYGNLWLSYQKKRDAVLPSAVMLPSP